MSDQASIIEEGRASIRSKASTDYPNNEDGVKRRPSKASLSGKGTVKQPPNRQPSNVQEGEDDADYEEELTERQKKIQLMKTIGFGCLKSCSSSFGLMVAVILYSILGGYVFNILEAENQITDCKTRRIQYTNQETEIINRLLDVAEGADNETMGDSYKKLLRRFRKIVYEVDYNGDDCELIGKTGGTNNAWSVSGAAMFAVTITTTIGYGHISPKTFWGKMVCIAYAVLGIPLMLLFLANIGDVLADFFKFFYSKICCCGCCRRKEDTKGEDAAPGRVEPSTWATEASGDPRPPSKGPIVVDDDEFDDEFDEDNTTIPLTVTLGVIFGYIMFGALLFGNWEDWSAGDAAYFSFVTLSTIGFGDYVPGQNGWDDPTAQLNLIFGAVYMIFGMAILSMCFTLIQDEIAAKFTWIGKKLGLVDKHPQEDIE